MKRILLGVLFVIFTMFSLESYSQINNKDLRKQEKLWRTSNFFKSKSVSKGFVDLYKRVYHISEVEMPFTSFKRIYPTNILHYDVILHTKDCIGDQFSTPIAMLSSDNECIIYLQVLSQFGDGWKEKTSDELKKFLAMEVRCNKEDKRYWQGDITEDEIKQLFDENILVHENDELTGRCNADELLLCHFPCRDKIGVVEKGNYATIHDEYNHFYTLIIYKRNEIPIKMNLFTTDNGFENINKYLYTISNSLKY